MEIIRIIVIKKGIEEKKGYNTKDTCIIQDGRAVTRFGNPNDAFETYRAKLKIPEVKKELVELRRGLIIEYHPDETKEAIRDHVVKFIEEQKENFKKNLDIQYIVEEDSI